MKRNEVLTCATPWMTLVNKHHGKSKEPDTKCHAIRVHLHEMYRTGKSTEAESTLVLARGCGGGENMAQLLSGRRVSFWGDDNALELDSSRGCKTL